MTYPGIEQALKNGCRLHAFRSGGGLRVILLNTSKDAPKGYGEHPHVEDALRYASDDYIAGGRPYAKVYGPLVPHYLTGSSEATSDLDAWLLRGATFDAWQEGESVVFELCGLHEERVPDEILKKAKETGEAIWETPRGYTYACKRTPDGSVQAAVMRCPEGKRPQQAWMYYISKRGSGPDFPTAIVEAFKAPEVEVPDSAIEA